jgi:hypothetical protein
MLFYWHFPEDADTAFMSIHGKLSKVAGKAKVSLKPVTPYVTDYIRGAVPYKLDEDFAGMHQKLLSHRLFKKVAQYYHPAKLLVVNDDDAYIVDWVGANLTVHGSPVECVKIGAEENGKHGRAAYREMFAPFGSDDAFSLQLQYPLLAAIHIDHIFGLGQNAIERFKLIIDRAR